MRLLLPLLMLLLLSLASVITVTPALALTLVWDRNVEPDMSSYNVWTCDPGTGPPCSKANGQIVGSVSQPNVGIVPIFSAGSAIQGTRYFVTALDIDDNESSESSVVVIADAIAPAIPQNFRCQTIESGFICKFD